MALDVPKRKNNQGYPDQAGHVQSPCILRCSASERWSLSELPVFQNNSVIAKVANTEDPSRVRWDAGAMSSGAKDHAHSLCWGKQLLLLAVAAPHLWPLRRRAPKQAKNISQTSHLRNAKPEP